VEVGGSSLSALGAEVEIDELEINDDTHRYKAV
jgi:hypothetical protein